MTNPRPIDAIHPDNRSFRRYRKEQVIHEYEVPIAAAAQEISRAAKAATADCDAWYPERAGEEDRVSARIDGTRIVFWFNGVCARTLDEPVFRLKEPVQRRNETGE